ncbi:MAG: hypothetical protein QXU18_03820 [Thermoplasmatales archaeon]
MARLNVSLTNEMAKKIQDSADADGKTISSIITESVDLYLHIKNMGLSRSQLMKLMKFLEVTKSVDAVPVPSLLLDTTLNLALANSGEKVIDIWCETGRIAGELIKSIVPDIRQLAQEFKEYSLFTPLTKMELKTDENGVELILMGTGYSMGSARVTAGAIKCFLEVYGVKNLSESISEGFVKVNGSITDDDKTVDEE